MSIDIIEYKNEIYPKFQAEGNAAQFCIPFARKVCKGIGYDIGCNRIEWKFDDSIPIDITLNSDALDLPDIYVDYIFSSHCLEHLPNWVTALDHWISRLKIGGVIFLYLPHISQKYWKPWNNKKHIHSFQPGIISDFFKDRDMKNIFESGCDLNNSFIVIAEK